MRLVIYFIFAAYAAMHIYFFFKVQRAFRAPFLLKILLAGFVALMFVAPSVVFHYKGAFPEAGIRVVGDAAYVWMAMLLWFCSVAILVDIWNLLLRGIARLFPAASLAIVPPRLMFKVAAAVIVLAMGWGILEARAIRVREVRITSPHLPLAGRPVRLVQISDLHLDIYRGESTLRRVLALVAKLKPDILVSTGDLVDSSFRQIGSLSQQLRAVQAPMGKYAVLGNHEYFAGLDSSLAFHDAAGFRVLRGESVMPSSFLILGGVDDPVGQYLRRPCFVDESDLFPTSARGAFAILLKHQPRLEEKSINHFDLQLSGHTHGGQVFPFHFVIWAIYKYAPGMHRVSDRSLIYVSRGAGVWGPPFRLFAPPEITLILLTPAQSG